LLSLLSLHDALPILSSGTASTPAFMRLMESQNQRFAATFFYTSEVFFKPSPHSAAARCVADFSSRSPRADSSSVPRSVPQRHPRSEEHTSELQSPDH